MRHARFPCPLHRQLQLSPRLAVVLRLRLTDVTEPGEPGRDLRSLGSSRAPTPVPYPGYTQLEPSTGLHVTTEAIPVDINSFRLEVTGLVDQSLSLSYYDLRCLPKVTAHVKLECPGYFIDEMNLSGVTFAKVLALAGPLPDAKRVRVSSVERYSMSYALDVIQDERNFLAYQWEDQLLPASHGFPLRGVMPGETRQLLDQVGRQAGADLESPESRQTVARLAIWTYLFGYVVGGSNSESASRMMMIVLMV